MNCENKSDETRLSGELYEILDNFALEYTSGYISIDSKLEHGVISFEDCLQYKQNCYDNSIKNAEKQIINWHETEKQKSYTDGFINGAKFELLELLNNAAYASRKTVDTKVIIGRLGSVNEGHSELNKSKGATI